MPKREIEFLIDQDGNVQIDVKNGEGPTCIKETSDLEKKLGIVESREKKPEYFKKVGIKKKEHIYSKR